MSPYCSTASPAVFARIGFEVEFVPCRMTLGVAVIPWGVPPSIETLHGTGTEISNWYITLTTLRARDPA
jgi:hypothetical protein